MSRTGPAAKTNSGSGDRDSPAVVRLRAEDLHAANRLALYRAKLYGRPSTTGGGDSRLRELERVREGTARRLREALAAGRKPDPRVDA
jgi:hypothetical protein